MTDLDLTSVTRLAETILKPKSTAQVHPVDLVHGIIVDFGPNSLTCVLYGTFGDDEELGTDSTEDNTPAPGIRFLETYEPKLGDNVWILKQGGNMICLGQVRTAPEELENFIRVGVDEGYGFSNNFDNYGNGWVGLRYWMDPDGLVHIEGRVKCNVTPSNGQYIHLWVGEESPYPGPGTIWGSPFEINVTAVRYSATTGASPITLFIDDTGFGLRDDGFAMAGAATYIDLSGITFPSKQAWYGYGLKDKYMRMRPQRNNDLTGGWTSHNTTPSALPMVWKRWDGMCVSKGVFRYLGSTVATDRVLASIPHEALKTSLSAAFACHGRLGASSYRLAYVVVRSGDLVLFTPNISGDVDTEFAFEGKIWWSDYNEEAWQPVEYANGWSNITPTGVDGSYPTPSWYIDQYGVCHLRGCLGDNGGTATKTDAIGMALLPEECRPMGDEKLSFFAGGSSSRIAIDPNNVLHPDRCAILIDDATPTSTLYYLDGISWRTRIEKFSDSIPDEEVA
jgi:hypothetical protein